VAMSSEPSASFGVSERLTRPMQNGAARCRYRLPWIVDADDVRHLRAR
jgi:hypothetical protein